MSILTASNLKVSYGDLEVFSDISLEIPQRARIGMIGPNGGGKTSLLRVLIGDLEPNDGHVYRANGLRTGYVPQTTHPITEGTIRDEVMVAFEELPRLERAIEASAAEMQRANIEQLAAIERRYASLLDRYEALGGYDYHKHAERVAAGVGLTADTLDNSAASASGGERTRAALARALLTAPDLLVLDEPTNYLDFNGLAWLENLLRTQHHTFVVVSHDRYFLDTVAGQIWELDHGRLSRYPGNYSTYRNLKAERLARHIKEHDRQQEFIEKEQAFIDRYRAGQRSREAKGREKRLARMERIERPHLRERAMRVANRSVSRVPRVVVRARDLGVGITTNEKEIQLIAVPDLVLERASRTAIIGSNGVGKTTLLQTILGEIPPLWGSFSIGDNVNVGYHRQGNDDLPDAGTVLEAMQEVRSIPPVDERDYLASFLFHGDDVFADVSTLSGGERTRLAVARLMATEPNFLVLDEPTTHLDIPSQEALEKALQGYGGTLLFVSHNRHLISELARQLLVIEDGAARLFEGSFEEWSHQTNPVASTPQASPPKQAPAKRSTAKPRKKRTAFPNRATPPEIAPDHEKIIAEMESRLARIERALRSATERRDVEEIARLGEEYELVQAELERAWNDWQQ
jgi:ATP-binding cassette subfamily F protein 3